MTRPSLLAAALSGICAVMNLVPLAASEGHSYPLFDGKSLHGWTVENDCEVAVEGDRLVLKSGNGWLRSDHTCSDFVLHVEWRALQAENYDAGIYLRAGNQGRPFPKSGYQVNLLQGREGHVPRLDRAVTSGLVKPAGQWNTFEITAVGPKLSLRINDRRAYEVEGLAIPSGYIGLQVEVPKGGQFEFRNLRITELTHRSLFDGQSLAHWRGADQPAEVCWEVQDGELVCTRKRGPWLRSVDQYGDFNLRLEYQVAPGGNSGVYVRVPADGKHHRDSDGQPPAGVEVQILDDSAGKHATLKDYQYSGGVYDIAGPAHRVSNPPGEWNTLEIDCQGHNITTAHNGIVIVEVAPERFPAIELRNLRGYLGLQNHGGAVRFRNIRIGPPMKLPPSQ